jgi:hypothetical protein
MAQFRAKKLDLGCFVNVKVIRDHTKRKVFQDHEVERYVTTCNPAMATLFLSIQRDINAGLNLGVRC